MDVEALENTGTEQWTIREDGGIADPLRTKTSLRMHYEAQVEVFKRQVGDLEDIRGRLGLTQRKICQLLMVDPSAWTRWIKGGDSAPPHIYRALHWYLILQDKLPGLTPQYFTGRDPEVLHHEALKSVESFKTQWSEQNQELEKQNGLLLKKIRRLEAQTQANKAAFYLVVIAILILSAAAFAYLRTRHA